MTGGKNFAACPVCLGADAPVGANHLCPEHFAARLKAIADKLAGMDRDEQ